MRACVCYCICASAVGCYAILWAACSALLCGAKGKQRDAVSKQRVKDWAVLDVHGVTSSSLADKIKWGKREGE